MKKPLTEYERASLVHTLGHMYGDGWNKVLILDVEAYIVHEDEYRIITHVVRSWPYRVPAFFYESKPPVYQGQDI